MGLSASQARLLDLTSRMHDIEYKAQNLEAQKLQMANESDQVYQTYENALNTQKIQMKSIGSDGSSTYKDATFATVLAAGSGYTLNVYLLQDVGSNKAGTWMTVNNSNLSTVLSGLGITDSSSTFSNMVQAGLITFEKTETSNGASSTTETNVATDTNFQEVSDDTETKKAEAKYEADMAKIDAKDKKFDTDIASLDNERDAIKTEIDTLKTVAKDNIDRTFKLFS